MDYQIARNKLDSTILVAEEIMRITPGIIEILESAIGQPLGATITKKIKALHPCLEVQGEYILFKKDVHLYQWYVAHQHYDSKNLPKINADLVSQIKNATHRREALEGYKALREVLDVRVREHNDLLRQIKAFNDSLLSRGGVDLEIRPQTAKL